MYLKTLIHIHCLWFNNLHIYIYVHFNSKKLEMNI